MKVVSFLGVEHIIPEIRSTRKLDVIKELGTFLAQHHAGLKQGEVVRVLLDRERQGSTAIGYGVAIPHGKLDTGDQLVACLARSRKGVDFDSMDGKPTHFFFVLLAPLSPPGLHLKALARISRLFKDADLRARLLAAESAEEMHRIIAAENAA